MKEKSFSTRVSIAFIVLVIALSVLIHLFFVFIIRTNVHLTYLLISSLVFIFLGILIIQFLKLYFSKRLSKLENFAKRVATREWNEPLDFKTKDEFGRLADAMNLMQEELKRADEKKKEYFQNVSHDLKTPTMVIMSVANAVIDGVHFESFDEAAEIINNEAVKLQKTIDQLLLINTLDYMLEYRTKTSIVEFDKLVENIVIKFKALAGHLELDLDLEKAKIEVNDEKLTIAIENILDNAIRYAKNKISVSLKPTGNIARLEIFNNGDHMSSEGIEKFFGTFYVDDKG